MTTYNYLRGRLLQSWYSIDIEQEEDSQVVYFNSTVHVKKRTRMPVTYGMEYAHGEILCDDTLIRALNQRFGKVTEPDLEAPF